MKQKGFDNMKISAVVLTILLTCVLNSEAKDKEENLKSDIVYVAPSGVKCVKCSPGTHLLSHCVSENTNSRCQLCEDGTFTSEYNVAEYCDPCMEYCEIADLVPVVNCSNTSNLICECPNGKFNLFPHLDKYHAVCQKFGLCGPGYGVYVKGTSKNNTTCARCVSGKTFSSTTSEFDECQPCIKCGPRIILTECTLTENRKCNLEPPVQHRVSSPVDWKLVLAVVLSVATVLILGVGVLLILWLRKSKKCCFNEEHGQDAVRLNQLTDERSPNRSAYPQSEYQAYGDQRSESSLPVTATGVALSLPSTSSQPNQTPKDSWGSSFYVIRQSVGEYLITNGPWEFFIREYYQVTTNNSDGNVDAKITEIKINHPNNVKEQIYQCLTFICERGATPEKLIEALIRREFHSLVATLRRDFPDVFNSGEIEV
ncbi:uncharacterized protein LOC110446325 [Mizuhopecten yessoensis]|uniref:Tumor necrosis factor receptor superfamily member 1B n=1 Tax=Mizuhopecten yessoensis TaxID=6573 RepID=A0A210QXR0_MIZYE|nr:uncharacterized protein LOC110446325 [Mizuhopecten yessoensis]OWF53559.1 Tumor necrosis factor receptor superfamily member 1B [Mizuhopecten yessoensis]